MKEGVGEMIEHVATKTIFEGSTNEIVNSYLSGKPG